MASISLDTTFIAFQDGQESVGASGSLEPREPDPNAPDQAPGGFFNSPLMPLMMILFLAFLIFGGGDKKRRQKREVMIGALKKGDEVMTTGGLFGHVSKIDEDVITLVVADGVRMRFSTSAIQGPAVEPEPDDKGKDKDKDKGKEAQPAEEAPEKAKA
jgi:preprotein translocase subunit YajC